MKRNETSNALLRDAEISQHCELKGGYREIILKCPDVASAVAPGQFAHLRVPHLEHRILRRPFSIFKAEDGYLVIIYKCVGVGTEMLAKAEVGEKLSVLGPLGNGFPYPASGVTPVLVGGGYGAAALYMTAKRSNAHGIVFLGGRTQEDLLCVEDFKLLGWDVAVATEDGSLGKQGLITELLDAWLAKRSMAGNAFEFFACGPHGMLKAVGERAVSTGSKGWLSMDRPMGCGVGACLACVQKIRQESGQWEYERICKDGPVFECRDICWDDCGGAE